MRRLTFALLASLTLGCGGTAPDPLDREYERSYYRPLNSPPEVFASMDLPYFGGQVERATETYMQVSYRREATVEQLKEWWPAAVKTEGWVPVEEGMKDNGGFAGQYNNPTGGTAALTINPVGTLWMVDLNVYP